MGKASVKKTINSNKKKKISLKDIDFKKNWKKLSLFGLVAVVALSSLGYVTWQELQSKDAGAYSWYPAQHQFSTNNTNPSIFFCQITSTSGYFYVVNRTSSTWTVRAFSGGTVTARPNSNSSVGAWSGGVKSDSFGRYIEGSIIQNNYRGAAWAAYFGSTLKKC